MIDLALLLPFLVIFPMAGAVVSYIIGRRNKNARNMFANALVTVEFAVAIFMSSKSVEFSSASFCGLGINFADGGLRGILSVLCGFIWFTSTLFSTEYLKSYRNRNRYYFFMLSTLGATMGVFLSTDFYTALIFFEIMSFTSYVLVVHDETEEALYAGATYLAVAVIGGLVTLLGMFFMYHLTGTLDMRELGEIIKNVSDKKPYYIAGLLISFGFGAKAGAFPLHIWLPQAHPVAPAPASALLSCILTKAGVFGILALSCQVFMYDANWGFFVLIIGTITMVLGAVIAVFSINLKRTLACSSLSQIGFILVGIGMQGLLGEENALASGGTILHIINHGVIKCTLFLCAGVVYMNIHKLNLNEIRGWGKDKPFLKIVFLIGLLGIVGIPLWGGYISKTLLHESIVEYSHLLVNAGQSTLIFDIIEWLFLFSGGLTLAYMTKLYMALFVEENPYPEKHSSKGKYMNHTTTAVLLLCATIITVFGILPHNTLDVIAHCARPFMNSTDPAHAVHYFSFANLKGALITVVIGAAVFFLFVRKALMATDENGNRVYIDAWPSWLDIEKNIYRPVLVKILPAVLGCAAKVFAGFLEDLMFVILVVFVLVVRFFTESFEYIAEVGMYIFLNKEMPKYGEKREYGDDVYFSTFTPELHDEEKGFRENLSGALVFFGVGMVAALLYIIF
ncbi:MAG: sodium:proton antiporter [Clostridia bacterium]|nr:sodium:proton antiporter [Clostridia bacterium]MCI2000041.1 sodium:proton antiporter [Clostridia bacterium]MCI2014425.1 sodium:proton antiporter [Clostridia bacterium]